MKIPEGDIQAYLFDCDGTLANSMPIHYLAWQEALKPWKCEFPEDLFYQWAGRSTAEIILKLNEIQNLKMIASEVESERDRHYLKHLPGVEPLAEVIEHVILGYDAVPMAVVSGSPRASVIQTLTYLGILDKFKTIVGAEDYQKGKPDPEPYWVAARRLGVEPSKCLVFEDAQLGIDSAVAAGMKWVKIPSSGR